ncbi:MAG: DUF2848 domain-containing protein [Alphaproteobacteria bacterium]|nr:DUF2848 domain-containing protein [Alphaproteobacteria bacterium]MBT4016634.1 DUF2848 domain-containing protein [Alphaproteobacteria bacterium]MBT4966889.1 DUF2848 domain-containing protein [Alphaproteobacteria bacterium]MBT5161099.1 DUF2848 domain-containing protein [Alphaproteobacteria bacterium]MBT6387854.1 DUF2848 domain-containing protein [Alphaproteobacteria bacterium]
MSSAARLKFEFVTAQGLVQQDVEIEQVVIAGWTGRDQAALQAHIDELAEMGIPGPQEVPMFYRTSAAHLTTADAIQVIGPDSSGEVEYFVLKIEGELWLGVASEHTDRKAETVGITLAKQLCEKPLGNILWPYKQVVEHMDELILRSWIHENGNRVLYQEGTLSEMRPCQELIDRYSDGAGLADNTLMFGGTLAAIGGVRPSLRFDFELEDPVLGRSILHGYDIEELPITG